MIGFERLCEARTQIHHEIVEEFDGDVRAWTAAQGLDYDGLRRWARADMAGHEEHELPLSPAAALLVGVQIGLRLGRAAAET